MYKVLIVDDERLIRMTLQNMLDWKELNCDVVAAVKDGIEAYGVFQKVHPDLIITDLKMPQMDGIELIRKVKEERADTQIIALSNYSDFELVRDAMKAGAADYLLKVTLDKEQLEKAVRQRLVHCESAQEKEDSEEIKWLNHIKQTLLLIKNQEKIEKEDAYLESAFVQPYKKEYQVAYLHVDNIHLFYEEKYEEYEKLEKFLYDQMRDSVPLDIEFRSFFLNHHTAIILLQGGQKQRMANICHTMIRNIQQYLNVQISFVLSNVMEDIKDFYQCCGDVFAASRNHFYRGSGTLMFVEEKEEYVDLDVAHMSWHKDIMEAMSTRDFQKAEKMLEESFNMMEKECIEPYQVIEYYIFILHNIEGNEMVKGHKNMYSLDTIVMNLRHCDTFSKLKEVLMEGFVLVEEWLKDENFNRYRQEVVDVMNYLDENYQEKLSLKEIAEHFSMSESSLSHLFKNETGMNLKSYINEKRMKKALELLSNESFKIKDVAAQIGMEDQLYFNRVFKKYYDLSPSDYRKKLQEERNENLDEVIE